jgi:hypothetical protein
VIALTTRGDSRGSVPRVEPFGDGVVMASEPNLAA